MEPPLQEHTSYNYQCIGFLDDYQLVICVSSSEPGGSPGLLLLDTERASPMGPTQTRFRGPPSYFWTCLFEEGGYRPSTQDILTAPFYSDVSQRILALSAGFKKGFYVMKVETLLRSAKERAGEEVQWEEWKPCLVQAIPQAIFHAKGTSQVSGSRLFSTFTPWGDRGLSLRVYDFSPHARVEFLRPGNNKQCKAIHLGVAAPRLPWADEGVHRVTYGHNSMVARCVSRFPPSLPQVAQ